MTVSRQDDDTVLAAIIRQGLSRVCNAFPVTLKGELLFTKTHYEREIYGRRKRSKTLKVIVYGFLRDKSGVANILSDDGLFLQHPALNGYDTRVKYVNAQYLLRRGHEMPSLEELITPNEEGEGRRILDDRLDEIRKDEIMRIFDSASGEDFTTGPNIEQSSRLVATLKQYVNPIRPKCCKIPKV